MPATSPGTRDTFQTTSMPSCPQQTGNQEQERLRILAQIPDPWLQPWMVTDWVGGCNVEYSDFDLNVCDEKGSGQGLQTLLLLHPGVDGYYAQSTYKDFLPLF
jgi:hypothetical protein